ncbi:MAG: 50S ribosomal protein L23 [Candidatus Paceibacterota bacterium]
MPATSLPKGGDADSYRVISRPHVTEKGTMLGEHNKYVFKVATNSNKIEIKKAVQELYKVKVEKVHVLNTRSKSRNIGRFSGSKPGFKKAIVTLKEGDRIEIAA